jgi:hypothetical protein
MRTREIVRPWVLGIAFVAVVLQAGRAAADPVAISGFLYGQLCGAQIQEELHLAFPGFAIVLPKVTHPQPGLCIDGCGNGTPVPFAQNTGPFSTQAIAIPGLATIDADVTGSLSFVGPTDVIDIKSDQFASDFLIEHVRFSGVLTVKQGTHTLFDGAIAGSGTASVLYTNRFGRSRTILDDYQYEFTGLGATPEPASIALLGTGVVWLAARRRRRTISSPFCITGPGKFRR